MSLYETLRNQLRMELRNYVEMSKTSINSAGELMLKCRDELIDKIFLAKSVYYRQEYRGKCRSRKRPILKVSPGRSKNTFLITLKENQKTYAFKLNEYGTKWVVDKKDYLPYINIIE